MEIQFVTQPFHDGSDLRDFIVDLEEDTDITHIRAAIAWAKRSGLLRVQEILNSIQDRGAIQFIIGISEGGATRQGLELALELADEVYVFHDPAGRTFHPKVYLGTGQERASLLVGSHNLTAGGVYYNYEAGLRCRLDLSVHQDSTLVEDVNGYFDRLVSDERVCKLLDSQLLDRLLGDPSYRIGDEDVNRRSPSPGESQEPDAPEDTDTVTEDETELTPVFGRSAMRKRPGPAIGTLVRVLADIPKTSSQTEVVSPQRASNANAVKRWWKKMSSSDAQKPPRPTSQVTGNLRLSKAGHEIDHKSYFRNEFFQDANWTRASLSEATYEMCHVDMDVVIDGEQLGVTSFRIDYLPSRIADQGNVPTVLKWGDLGNRLSREDHSGEYVVIERLDDGSFRLRIQSAEPAPFLA